MHHLAFSSFPRNKKTCCGWFQPEVYIQFSLHGVVFLFLALCSEQYSTKRLPFKRTLETRSFMSALCFVKLTHCTCQRAIVMEIYSSAVDSRDHKSFSLPEDMSSRKKPRDSSRLLWRWHCCKDKLNRMKKQKSQAYRISQSENDDH